MRNRRAWRRLADHASYAATGGRFRRCLSWEVLLKIDDESWCRKKISQWMDYCGVSCHLKPSRKRRRRSRANPEHADRSDQSFGPARQLKSMRPLRTDCASPGCRLAAQVDHKETTVHLPETFVFAALLAAEAHSPAWSPIRAHRSAGRILRRSINSRSGSVIRKSSTRWNRVGKSIESPAK